jgi:predicted ATPase
MRIVLTGGPGAGKTSVIEELERIGHKIVAEPARTLIEHYKIHSPELLPALSRENRKLFQIAIENNTINDFLENEEGFFDRSILDEIGYRNRYDIAISNELHRFAKDNRYDVVFIFPFWKEIYKTDDVRHETPEEAEIVCDFLHKAYVNYGYNPIVVPKVPIKERMDFIFKNIK